MADPELDPRTIINAIAEAAAADYRSAIIERAVLKAQVVALTEHLNNLEKPPGATSEQGA